MTPGLPYQARQQRNQNSLSISSLPPKCMLDIPPSSSSACLWDLDCYYSPFLLILFTVKDSRSVFLNRKYLTKFAVCQWAPQRKDTWWEISRGPFSSSSESSFARQKQVSLKIMAILLFGPLRGRRFLAFLNMVSISIEMREKANKPLSFLAAWILEQVAGILIALY